MCVRRVNEVKDHIINVMSLSERTGGWVESVRLCCDVIKSFPMEQAPRIQEVRLRIWQLVKRGVLVHKHIAREGSFYKRVFIGKDM